MPSNANVFIHHGSYESCVIVEHSEDRLDGLKNVLQEDGHGINLVKGDDWNIVDLWVNGEKIFSCDIRDLDFGGDGKLDPLCEKALEAVRKAF